MPGSLAPIGLSAYTRLKHLRRTVSALKKNALADKSSLFVFSDAPQPGDEAKVEEVRGFLRTIKGFKDIQIFERTENNRIANNRGGMSMLLQEYGRMIFLEEDIVTSPGFLSFMNQALDKYEDNEQVFSITGYCPPISIPDDYSYDLFFMRRFNAWGFGIWNDRYECIKYVSPEEYERLAANKEQVLSFAEGGGADMLKLLKLDAYGKIDALDIKAMYTQFRSNRYTVYPTRSLSSNIGMDGTGIHCAPTIRFNVDLSDKTSFCFPDDLTVDSRIIKANRQFRALRSYVRRIVDRLYGIINNLFPLY